jgi:hypothetical protein
MRRWVWLWMIAACTGDTPLHFVDATISNDVIDEGFCNVLTQTGCNVGEKCTWIHDVDLPDPIGHIGCAPDLGGVRPGGACTVAAPQVGGYDNCVKGDACIDGFCTQICDLQGGTTPCGGRGVCAIHPGVFGDPPVAGTCERVCDPLDDNDFLGSGTRPGSACGSSEGCYGLPRPSPQTQFTCKREGNATLLHRSACTNLYGCADVLGRPFFNGCAQGYTPFLRDATGSTVWDCFAYCSPGNAYLGNPSTQDPNGKSPHGCNTTDARGAFGALAAGSANGEHCMYGWVFEYDHNHVHVASPSSDTIGICVDHTKYRYDSNHNGAIDGSDAFWPPCTSLGVGSQLNGGYDATYFGCVDTTTAAANGTLFTAKAHL